MTSVQFLLDQLGRPPAEVCLDWAWQLRTLQTPQARQTPHAISDGSHSAVAGVPWSAIEVDQQGMLKWCVELEPAVNASTASLEPLIATLVAWAEASQADGRQADDSHRSDCDPLVRATLLVALAPQPQRPVAPHGQHRKLLNTAKLPQRGAAPSTPATASPTRSAGRLAWLAQPMKRRFLLCGFVTAGLALCWITWRETHWLTSSPATGARLMTALTSSDKADSSQSASPTTSEVYRAKEAGLQPDQTRPSAEQSSLRLSDSFDSRAAPPLASDFDTRQDLANVAASLTVSGSTVAAVDMSPAATAGVEETLTFTDPSLSIPGDFQPSASDVLNGLTQLVKSAEAEVSEEPIAVDADAYADVPQGPLQLSVFPITQVLKFDATVRPKEAAWQLRLSVGEATVGEGLSVEPAQIQTLTGRGFVSWRIAPAHRLEGQLAAASQQPTAQLLVQAQLMNGRDTSLRWRVMAGAADLPAVTVPFQQEFLDRAQLSLREQQRWLQSEVERVRGLARVPGLPSGARSTLSTHRQFLEAQQKLATRLLAFVAEANQFSGWLGGQIEVHAALIDTAATTSTPLLQFGTP